MPIYIIYHEDDGNPLIAFAKKDSARDWAGQFKRFTNKLLIVEAPFFPELPKDPKFVVDHLVGSTNDGNY